MDYYYYNSDSGNIYVDVATRWWRYGWMPSADE
jgi:hypothetical protein